ncbi:MAG: BlaI/MecI/CopY family transcriptional regulator [Candidatus Zixiibacteriota bacterium]
MKKPFYFDPYATGTAVFLGPTEARLMELAWRKESLTVKKALLFSDEEGQKAYTTVMTVLARLAEKGLLQRRKEGRGFVYEPAIDRKTFLEERVGIVSNCLRKNFKDISRR